MKFRAKSVEISAIKWGGGQYDCLDDFCGKNWGRADAVGLEIWSSDIKDEEQVVIWNIIEKTWLPCPVGWWIIRGTEGELYPCRSDIFELKYEAVE